MVELDFKLSEPAECWPTFTDEHTVIGWKLLNFVDWVSESKRVLADQVDPGIMPVIALPPVQRSAVWRPKQVLDLWDSLMRGLPIGTFYLVSQPARAREVVLPGTNKTAKTSAKGFDLLDGQQRVRALMVGVSGPAEEKRCLWVDLGAETAERSPCLRLTSRAQPFGYDAETGGKLHLDQRRRARQEIEPDPTNHPLQLADTTGGLRRAYDLELFDGAVTQDNSRMSPQPPLPYKASKGQVFELHKLLAAWRKFTCCNVKEGVAALRAVTGDASELEKALVVLHEAFCNVERAQAALLNVDPGSLRGGDRDLLALFERIGAAGTPLSREERLYSIYKHHVPEIRDTVDAVFREAGRILPPTKIVGAALRIANALTSERQNNTPDPVQFTKEMTADPKSEFWIKLGQLLPEPSEVTENFDGSLRQSFATAKALLSHDSGAGSFWLPDVMLTMLPPELWQVLVFWATVHPVATNQDFCRQEAVRFALFWRLCVWNDDKAANIAFAYIKETKAETTSFPGAALYRRLIGDTRSEPLAHALLSSDEFKCRLCKDESVAWRTHKERFVENELSNDFGSNWWWNGRRMLPWLQKDYIREAFPGYAPLSEHEDDLPYDFDHICPYKDWGDWWSVRRRFEGVEPAMRQRMRDGRDAVGNEVGNLRIVDSSINKRDQDADIAEKMPFAMTDDPSEVDRQKMAKSAFPPEHRALWKRVSRPGAVADRKWNHDRLAAFQRAVEQRAAWLYQGFYDELGYAAWTSASRQSDHEQ